jgi:pimeloyl-ACP methyl ester carboxylesterase
MEPDRIDLPWGRMRVWRGGRGPALLALHGLGGSGRYWQGLEDLVGDRFTVVAPDLPGFGSSDKPKVVYDRSFLLDAVEAVARDLGPTVVVGHSLGGVLGFLWAARHPQRTRALNLSGSPFPQPRPDWDPARWVGVRRLAPAMVGGVARVTWPLLSLPAQAFSKYPGAVVRDYGRQTMRSRAWTMWSLWADPALHAELPDLAARLDPALPILLMHAADDRSVRPDAMDGWAGLLPMARRELAPEGGHQFLLHQRFAPLGPWLTEHAALERD